MPGPWREGSRAGLDSARYLLTRMRRWVVNVEAHTRDFITWDSARRRILSIARLDMFVPPRRISDIRSLAWARSEVD